MNKILYPKKLRSRAIKTIDALCQLELGRDVIDSLREARQRLALPLTEVLDKIPGDTVVERAKNIGIARQTYYQWLRGVARPNPEQAEKLAKLSGHNVDEIRGRAHDEGDSRQAASSG
jgi:DNA-binding XRE family transcriptional regulator